MNREAARKLVGILSEEQKIELSLILIPIHTYPEDTIDDCLAKQLACQEEMDSIIKKRLYHRRDFLQNQVNKLDALRQFWHGKYAIVCLENNALRRSAKGFNRRMTKEEMNG